MPKCVSYFAHIFIVLVQRARFPHKEGRCFYKVSSYLCLTSPFAHEDEEEPIKFSSFLCKKIVTCKFSFILLVMLLVWLFGLFIHLGQTPLICKVMNASERPLLCPIFPPFGTKYKQSDGSPLSRNLTRAESPMRRHRSAKQACARYRAVSRS